MAIQPTTMIIMNCVWGAFILLTIGYRKWMLHSLTKTPFRQISEAFILTLGVFVAAAVPLQVMLWVIERQTQLAHPLVSDDEILALTVLERPIYSKIDLAVGYMYAVHTWTMKFAFLLLFYDMKQHLTPALQILLYGSTAVTAATLLANFLFLGLYCRPITDMWDGKCTSLLSMAAIITQSWFNIITDLSILLLGIFIVNSLRRRNNAARTIWSLPFLGSISIISTLIRFVLCYKAVRKNDGDIKMSLVHELFLYSWIEVLLAWLAFALPAIRAYKYQKKRGSLGIRSNNLSSAGKINSLNYSTSVVSASSDSTSGAVRLKTKSEHEDGLRILVRHSLEVGREVNDQIELGDLERQEYSQSMYRANISTERSLRF